MSDACREYVTRRLGDSRLASFDLKEALVADVKAFMALHPERRLGCSVRLLYTEPDVERENLDREALLAVGERLPLMYVNIGFRTEETSAAELAELEARNELRLVREVVWTW